MRKMVPGRSKDRSMSTKDKDKPTPAHGMPVVDINLLPPQLPPQRGSPEYSRSPPSSISKRASNRGANGPFNSAVDRPNGSNEVNRPSPASATASRGHSSSLPRASSGQTSFQSQTSYLASMPRSSHTTGGVTTNYFDDLPLSPPFHSSTALPRVQIAIEPELPIVERQTHSPRKLAYMTSPLQLMRKMVPGRSKDKPNSKPQPPHHRPEYSTSRPPPPSNPKRFSERGTNGSTEMSRRYVAILYSEHT